MQSAPASTIPTTKRRWLRRLTTAFLVGVVLFVAGSWYFAYRLTKPHQHSIGNPPADFSFPIESITLNSNDGRTVCGWLVPADDRERAIILLHGYTGDRTTMLARAKFFREQGYTVLLYDACACGESAGECITFGYHESHDLLSALEFLRRRDYQRIACLGVSQGGATILFAGRFPQHFGHVRCVICESVYDELEHAVDRRFRRYFGIPGRPACCLLVPFAEWRTGIAIDEVKPVAHVGKLQCPVLLISGDQDNRVYVEDTQALFAAAQEPKELWLIPGAGHHDLFRCEGYELKVTAFLERHMK